MNIKRIAVIGVLTAAILWGLYLGFDQDTIRWALGLAQAVNGQ